MVLTVALVVIAAWLVLGVLAVALCATAARGDRALAAVQAGSAEASELALARAA